MCYIYIYIYMIILYWGREYPWLVSYVVLIIRLLWWESSKHMVWSFFDASLDSAVCFTV